MRIFHLFIVIVFFFTPIFGQNNDPDKCEVSVVALKKSDGVRKALGTFNTVVAEEEWTTKSYRLPASNLFVTAAVFYTDESMASKDTHDSVSLLVQVSKYRKWDPPKSIAWAEAEFPYGAFEIGRVHTIIKINAKSNYITLECKSVRQRDK